MSVFSSGARSRGSWRTALAATALMVLVLGGLPVAQARPIFGAAVSASPKVTHSPSGDWVSTRAGIARAEAVDPACAPEPQKGWSSVEGLHSFRIWYFGQGEEALANSLASEMDGHIWPKLVDEMGVSPVSAPLEICLETKLASADDLAVTVPTGATCEHVSSYIDELVQPEQDARDVLAHEFMHVLQFALRVPCANNDWWRESTAEWAIDDVYPHDNIEHGFADSYLKDTANPLPSPDGPGPRPYGSYLFPFFLAHTFNPQLIGTIWHAAQKKAVVPAIDDSVPGGLMHVWPKFAVANWNKWTANQYDTWDKPFSNGTWAFTKKEVPNPGAAGEQDVGIPVNVKHLAAEYRYFEFSGGVRTVTYINSKPYAGDNPDAHVWAIIEKDGEWQEPVDWTGKQGKAYCLADTSEKINALVLVYSNSSQTADIEKAPEADLGVTDAGCKSWAGMLDYQYSYKTDAYNYESKSVLITFDAQHTFPTDYGDGENLIGAAYRTKTAAAMRFEWKYGVGQPASYCSFDIKGSARIPPGWSPVAMTWPLEVPRALNVLEWYDIPDHDFTFGKKFSYSCHTKDGTTTQHDTWGLDADSLLPTKRDGTPYAVRVHGLETHEVLNYHPVDDPSASVHWGWDLISDG